MGGNNRNQQGQDDERSAYQQPQDDELQERSAYGQQPQDQQQERSAYGQQGQGRQQGQGDPLSDYDDEMDDGDQTSM